MYSFLGPPPGSLLGPAVVFGVGVEVGSTAGPARSSSSSNPGQRGNRDRSG